MDVTLIDKAIQDLVLEKHMIKLNKEKRIDLENKINELTEILSKLESDMLKTDKASKLLKKLKIDKRDQDSNAITKALDSIIGQLFPNENLSFRIKSKLKGNHTYSKLDYYKGNSTTPRLIKYCSGHGLRQVVSFTTVYTLLALSDNTPTIILDECFRSISPAESELVSQVLNHLTELGFQLILIEHNEHIFKHLDKYGTYKLEKVFSKDTEYTTIKDYTVGGILNE